MAAGDRLDLFARKVAIVCVFILGVVFLWRVRRIVVLVLVAAVLAAGIAPVVERVRVFFRFRFHRRIRRGTAVLLVYLPFLAAAILFAIFGVPFIVAESTQLFNQLPTLLESRIIVPLEQRFEIPDLRALIARGSTIAAEHSLFGYIRSAVQFVASTIAVLFLIVYMLIDAERLRNLFLLFYPAHERFQKRRMMMRMSRRMSSWLSGQLILASIVATATFIALMALRVPYALPLAVLAGIGEMVPVIGPILGAVPAVMVALLGQPYQVWGVLISAILIQQFENYLLVPRLMGKKVYVSPLAIFIAFMMGMSLLGVLGAILAIPMAAVLQVFFEEAFILPRERRQSAERVGSLLKADRE